MNFSNMGSIIQHNKKLGNHFFDSGSLAWFDSVIYPKVYAGRFFITSEHPHDEHVWDNQRRWTIREVTKNGIDTFSDFGQYSSLEEAQSALSMR